MRPAFLEEDGKEESIPTLANMQIPPPKSWDEFQDITLTALKLRWRSPDLQQNGRQGQQQAGVDIYGSDDLGRYTGVQCKLTTHELKRKEVEAEVLKAQGFVPALATFFVATTGRRDAKIQTDVRLLSEARLLSKKFPVGVIFWEDLVQDLLTSPGDFHKHFPELGIVEPTTSSGFALLCALDVTYLGSDIKHMMTLIFGEIGQIANEDPHQIDTLLRSVEESARIFMSTNDHTDLVSASRALVKACHAAEWAKADGLATKIQGVVDSLEYRLSGRRLAAFTLGRRLRQWDVRRLVSEKPLSDPLKDDIIAAARILVADEQLAEDLRGLIIEDAEKNK